MAYTTQTNIEEAITEATLIQLTDDEGDGEVVTAIVTDAIEKADSYIDGYIGQKYSAPLSAPTPLVTTLSTAIAIYFLYKRRVLIEVPQHIRDGYDDAIVFLKDVAKGLATLGIDPAPTPSSGLGAATNKTTNDRVFTRNTMSGF
jgi:phage gp36-like protein